MYEEAQPVIEEVNDGFQLYNDVIVPAKASIDVARAVEARKANGSVLEYGLKWHLEKFVDAVKFSQLEKNIYFF